MKAFCLTTMIAVFLLLCTNGIQAQTTQTKLNQVELMKQFIGTWKMEISKDTTNITETTCFRNGALEVNQKILLKGKILNESKWLIGYDKKSDKYIGAIIRNDSPDIRLMGIWFTSKNTCEQISFDYISNPEQATSKTIYEFKSPDLAISTGIKNNKPTKTYSWTRLKK